MSTRACSPHAGRAPTRRACEPSSHRSRSATEATIRILYVVDGLPYPLTSGRLRQYHFLRELGARHEITLLVLADGVPAADDVEALRAVVPQVEVLGGTRHRPLPIRALRRGIAVLSGPLAGDAAALRDRVRILVARGRYAAAVLHGKRSYLVARDAAAIPTVADICDAASARAWARLAFTPLAERPRAIASWAEVAVLERRGMRAADHLVFATPRDRDALVSRSRRHVSIIPNGIDTAFWTRTTSARPPDTIAFTGAMDYGPNEDAALHLIQAVLPLVRSRRPSTRLLIVGRDPGPALIAAGETENVTVTGLVEDVRPYLDATTVFAAPIRFGAGIQNKVLEAMAMELPVVASPNAGDGLRVDGADVPPITIAETPAEAADALLAALEAAERDPAPIAENRRYVERHFVWHESARLLEAAVAEAVDHRSSASQRDPA